MKCPECQSGFARVVDTRERQDFVTRRRKCDACDYRFTTHERYVPQARITAQRQRQGRSLAQEYNGLPKRRRARKPKLPPVKPINVFLKARQWGLSIADLSLTSVELGLDRGVVLSVVQNAPDRKTAFQELAQLGVLDDGRIR